MSPKQSPPSRDRLIKAAADLFYIRGIQGVSVDAIVAEAGLTKPTLYKHFASKDELVVAVADYRSANWDRALEEWIAAAGTPLERLHAVFAFLERFISDESFRGCALVNVAVEALDAADPSRVIIRRNKRGNRRRLERLAREAGLPEPATLASALSLLFEGAIVTAYVESDPDAGRVAREAAEKLIGAPS